MDPAASLTGVCGFRVILLRQTLPAPLPSRATVPADVDFSDAVKCTT